MTKKKAPAKKKKTAKRKAAPKATPVTTPRHQWTHGGKEVLILRCCDKNGRSHNGFQWPTKVGETITAPDWSPRATCGNGLHGWPWGFFFGDGKEPQFDGLWIVFGADPAEVVDLDGKVKVKTATVRYVGDWYGAWRVILPGHMAWIAHASKNADTHSEGDNSASSATGDRSASSATGDNSASSATGDSSASSATGYRSASSATGDRSASSATGDNSASSATGYRSASSATGDASAAIVTGIYGRVKAGKYSALALAWWNKPNGRYEMRAAITGCGDGSDGLLKADVWYRLDDAGAFVEAV